MMEHCIAGQSKPISDAQQRGDQFDESTAKNLESGQGGSDVSSVGAVFVCLHDGWLMNGNQQAMSNAQDTAGKYASK